MVQRMFWHVKGVIENSVEFEADFTGLYDYCSHRYKVFMHMILFKPDVDLFEF